MRYVVKVWRDTADVDDWEEISCVGLGVALRVARQMYLGSSARRDFPRPLQRIMGVGGELPAQRDDAYVAAIAGNAVNNRDITSQILGPPRAGPFS